MLYRKLRDINLAKVLGAMATVEYSDVALAAHRLAHVLGGDLAEAGVVAGDVDDEGVVELPGLPEGVGEGLEEGDAPRLPHGGQRHHVGDGDGEWTTAASRVHSGRTGRCLS